MLVDCYKSSIFNNSLLLTTVMLSLYSFIYSALANEESTRNIKSITQVNYNSKIYDNKYIDIKNDNDHLNDNTSYSELIQEVMPNYKKVKKNTNKNRNRNTDANSVFGTKHKTKISNKNDVSLKRSSPFFIYSRSNNLIESCLHKTPLSISTHDNNHNEQTVFIDESTAASLDHKNNIMNNINIRSRQNSIDRNENNNYNGFPDIKDLPSVTLTELPLDFLQTSSTLDTILMDKPHEHHNNTNYYFTERFNNLTVDVMENTTNGILKETQNVKFNDSGGTTATIDNSSSDPKKIFINNNDNIEHIPTDINEINGTVEAQLHLSTSEPNQMAETSTIIKQLDNMTYNQPNNTTSTEKQQQINLTEEVPIPVFSEWAQKQMEAAEKQAALEQQEQTFNYSTQRKNHTKNGHAKKLHTLKVRLKNYASPDCGAKILASNSDATNTGAILKASRDEYMLSPCGNRIWFIVELCEAIQAQRVDLANFELFSSSPKNFTVAVSNRFPTRDWSNVGRFIAEDRRTIQSFELHPHLFGKYVRVDIHSHYAKEHFCPVSLFRVFGTSEFEAFETENLPNRNLDDYEEEDSDDDEIVEQQEERSKSNEPNIFKSASDAVLSIVKKAAGVLVKPDRNESQANLKYLHEQQQNIICQTPVKGYLNCTLCNQELVERINSVISCQSQQLMKLLRLPHLKDDLITTRLCEKYYNITIEMNSNISLPKIKDVKQSYYINILPKDYIGALCQLLAETKGHCINNFTGNASISSSCSKKSCKYQQRVKKKKNAESLPLNLTLNKKLMSDGNDITFLNKRRRKITKSLKKITEMEHTLNNSSEYNDSLKVMVTESNSIDDILQVPKPNTASNMDFNILNNPTTIATTVITTDTTTNTITSHTTATVILASEETETSEATERPKIVDVNIFNIPDMIASHYTNAGITDSSILENEKSDDLNSPNNTNNNNNNNNTKNVSTSINIDDVSSNTSEDTNSWVITTTNNKAVQDMPTPTLSHNGNNLLQQQKTSNGPHTESVFIRLSNRVKMLELNMSLSSQYLEELSRRYKKQVEELQQTLAQQTLNVRLLEERNHRHLELEQLYALRNAQLQNELNDLTLRLHAWIVVIILIATFVFLVLMAGILFYRKIRRDTKEILSLYNNNVNNTTEKHNTLINNSRRKSFEDFSDCRHHEISSSIYKYVDHTHEESNNNHNDKTNKVDVNSTKRKNMSRQRKMSICYNSQNHINYANGLEMVETLTSMKPNSKRRNDKHSWPNTAYSQMQAGLHLQELHSKVGKYCDTNEITCGLNDINENNIKSKRKKGAYNEQHQLKRVVSTPNEWTPCRKATEIPSNLDYDDDIEIAPYDESLRLDTDDLYNFLPAADLTYDEFMPEGPRSFMYTAQSPSQLISISNNKGTNDNQSKIYDNINDNGIDNNNDNDNNENQKSEILLTNMIMNSNNSKKNNKKGHRLSSPAFFKSAFTKGLKSKAAGKKMSHESTSWEWYRLKKTVPSVITSTTTAAITTSTITITSSQSQSLLPSITKTTAKSFTSPSLSTKKCSNKKNLSNINVYTSNSVDNASNSYKILENSCLSSKANVNSNKYIDVNNLSDNHLNDNNHSLDCNNYNVRNSSSSNSNSSNCSSNQSTKTQNSRNRTFSRIFRKVF